MVKKILLITALFFQKLFAADCYLSHITTEYQVEVEEEKVFLTQIRRDPNKISVFSYKKAALKEVSPQGIRYVSAFADQIIFANEVGYYAVSENLFESDILPPKLLAENQSVSEFFHDNIFCINGKWQQLTFSENGQWEMQNIEKFPNEPALIKRISQGIYLLKDKHSVYLYNSHSKLIEELHGLQPKTSQIKLQTPKVFLICDEDTMFFITPEGIFKNVTNDFKSVDFKQHIFLQVRIIKDIFGNCGLSFSDGNIWFLKENFSKRTPQFQLIKGVNFHFGSKLFGQKTDFYRSFNEVLLGKKFSINVEQVQNFSKLKYTNLGIYYDTDFFYKYDEITRKIMQLPTDFQASRYLNASFYTNEAANSFEKPFWSFWATEKDVFYLDENAEIIKEFAYQTPLKNLKSAYIADDKLLIENIAIRNLKNTSDLQFVGSIVKVENICQESQKIDYQYFFKDKSEVYVYRSGKRELEKLSLDAKTISEKQLCELFL